MVGDRRVGVCVKDLMHRINKLAAIRRYRRDIVSAASDLFRRNPAAAAKILQDHRGILLRCPMIGNDLALISKLLCLDGILTVLQIQRQTVFGILLIQDRDLLRLLDQLSDTRKIKFPVLPGKRIEKLIAHCLKDRHSTLPFIKK